MSKTLTLETMSARGGSFVKHLAQAAKYADSENYERLRGAFPDIWERYADMAERMTKQPEAQP